MITLLLTPAFLSLTLTVRGEPGSVGPGVPAFEVAPGYRVTLAVDSIDNPRFMEFDDAGTLYVSQPFAGTIYALKDQDGDGYFEWQQSFIEGRQFVHGMDFADGWLWFTQTGSVHRARDAVGDGTPEEVITVIPDGQLPSGGAHWYRSIVVAADGFYTSVGDSGNITDEVETERQKIWKFDLNGGNKTLFCSGIRNTEKLMLRPGTAEVWGVDHGSDWFGQPLGEDTGNQPITDNNPPDEFNHYVEGGFYGHPFLVGNVVPRIEYQDRADLIDLASQTIPPVWAFGAHWAANAFTFISRDHFPADHVGDAFVACRGSWNSSVRVGYRIERVLFDDRTGKPYGSLRIVNTLNAEGTNYLARPVDCVEAPDGTILFSSDITDRIFRISYIGN
jgi:glucose/arabinose dehydrogenase